MSGQRYIHGGTDAVEVARLEKQARWVSPILLQRFEAKPGMRVLDLATGVGAMAGQLLERWPLIELYGADLSASQLRIAQREHPAVRYVRANGAALPFPDGSFDRVHWTWFIEHVSKEVAVKALAEVRRVLKAGGYAHFTEVDNSTFRTVPALPHVKAAIDALNAGQVRGGGDPYVGQKIVQYAREAGFTRIDSRPNVLKGDQRDPLFLQGFIDEFAEIFESVDEALGAPLTEAAAELRGLIREPRGELHYTSVTTQVFKT
ncbi:MAG: methyltransferase domain-containing protein [Archangiaceae bacterium]|nr:methyltransferase domain-containing protein [Archangiaceae bacterium]